jgi:cardiolipin synthase
MFIRNWRREVFTIPNLLSLVRLLLLPVYARMYLNAKEPREYLFAGVLMAISCLTDLADGWIAREFDQVTNLGKVLDPMADKLTQFVLTLCLSLRYPVLKAVLVLLLLKEGFQIAAGIGFLARGKMLSGALPAGKVSTAVLFVSLIFLVIFPPIETNTVAAIASVNLSFLSLSFGSYFLAYFGAEPRLNDLEG